MTLAQLAKRISTQTNYAIYSATGSIPTGWPSEVMQFKKIHDTETKNETLNTWYMNLQGSKWQLFYSFGLTTYLNQFGSFPAFIYEKNTLNGVTTYKPVVSMLVNKHTGKIIQASKTWCDKVIDEANRHPVYLNE